MNNIAKLFLPGRYIEQKIMFWYKLGRYFNNHKIKILQILCEYKIYRSFKCIISCQATIGNNIKIPHPLGIVIGKDVVIGNNVTVYQNVTIGKKYKDDYEYPIIEDDVIIYCNSSVLGGLVVRKGTTIGANSVLLQDTEENSTYAGSPCKRINNTSRESIY